MRQWEIWTWKFPFDQPGDREHPAVIITPTFWAQNPDIQAVNVLSCSSHRATRQPERHEVILDEADGLDWPTLCKCHFYYTAPKPQLVRRRGLVSEARQRQLGEQIIRLFGFLPG
jgi:hypothetical protein